MREIFDGQSGKFTKLGKESFTEELRDSVEWLEKKHSLEVTSLAAVLAYRNVAKKTLAHEFSEYSSCVQKWAKKHPYFFAALVAYYQSRVKDVDGRAVWED